MPFQKGHRKIGGKVLGSKNAITLLKEERRAIFENEVTKVFIETIHKARPEYLLDQFMGAAPIKIESLQVKVQLSPETSAKIKKELKQQLSNGDK